VLDQRGATLFDTLSAFFRQQYCGELDGGFTPRYDYARSRP